VREQLREYRKKRDPTKTPEPAVKSAVRGTRSVERARGNQVPAAGRSGPVFVVQRHDATRLHYDFRLEIGGALASWAVPKGVPLEPGQQHLAVHVEDHPLEYATFEGEIPKGNYGAGTVEIWDSGTYELVERKRNGGLTVRLHGKKLKGVWALVPAKLSGDEKNWLIIRKRDEESPSLGGGGRYAPMLATLGKSVPRGEGWLYEVKWDGYRALAYVRGGDVELYSRNQNLLNDRFPSVAKEIAKAVRTPNCVLDGEVVAIDDEGRATFSAMQQGKAGTRYLYVAFDLLEVEGEPIVDSSLTTRRRRLAQLLDKRNKTVQISDAFDDGEALYRAAREQRFEGVVAKRADSRYEVGRRSHSWVKVKTTGRQEFVVGGYTKGEGRRSGAFGSLLLGVYDGADDRLRYVGSVGTGFTEKEIDRLLPLLRELETDEPPFDPVPKPPRVRKGDIRWVEPRLVAEVEFVEWTHDQRLRAPSYQGIREDKSVLEVKREEPLPSQLGKGRRTLKLSNVDKVFFPDEGITKGDLLAYYRAVAPVLVPHLKDRPFTMIRYPDGIKGKFFFQKDAPSHLPEWIETFRALVSTRESPRRKKWVNFALVNDELALLWMVNMGCIDMNAWYSRVDKPERPDFVLFDLDPSPDVGFAETVQVALLVKQALDAFGLVGYPKTSSADGMHIVVPIERRYTFDDTRRFAEIVAGAIARTHRGLATTEWAKDRRRGVLIDANQNGEGKTIATAYSVRPRPDAPVSTPLRWEELDDRLDARAFTMDVVLQRIQEHGDLFAGALTTKQRLNEALAALG
jgi:bifunctional non-homologous end joining protein LigD